MDNFTRLVRDALEYYDENMIKYYDLSQSFKYYSLDKPNGKIIFYDDNKQKIYDTPYDVIGKYIPSQYIWVWGWSSGELDKNIIRTSRNVLNYAFDLDKNEILLKTALITSRYRITQQYQIDIHVALATFLSKQPFIYKLDYFNDTNPSNKPVKLGEPIKLLKTHSDHIPMASYYLILLDK